MTFVHLPILKTCPPTVAIAHVTPYSWGAGRHEITTYVERTTAELAARGHQVVIIAPSRSSEAVRETRQAIGAARDDPAALLPEPGAPPRVLAVGDALPDLPGRARRVLALPVDISRARSRTCVRSTLVTFQAAARIPCYAAHVANLTITVDDDLLRRARARAVAQGTSVNAVLREELSRYVEASGGDRAAEAFLAVARTSTGSSGPHGRTWTREEIHADR